MRHSLLLGALLVCSCPQLLGANIVVNSPSRLIADDGVCSLAEAVLAADDNLPVGTMPGECIAGEGLPVVDEITFEPAALPMTILIEAPLELTQPVTIRGPHQDLVTLLGVGFSRLFTIRNVHVGDFVISDLTLSGGVTSMGDSVEGIGGAIRASMASATLRLERVRFENNSAQVSGGAVALFEGSANNIEIVDCTFIDNYAGGAGNGNEGGGGALYAGQLQTVDVEGSTFTANEVVSAVNLTPTSEPNGGAIWVVSGSPIVPGSLLTVRRSTFDGNAADGSGGAIAIGGPAIVDDYSVVTINSSTFVRNRADDNANLTGSTPGAGSIYSSAIDPPVVRNSLFSNNSDQSVAARDNAPQGIDSLGNNYLASFDGDSGDFPVGQPNANGDYVLFNQPGGVEPLAGNGGPTPTAALAEDSPALDKGSCTLAGTDQRGYGNPATGTRAVDLDGIDNDSDGCDIGAFERAADVDDPAVAIIDRYLAQEDSALIVGAADGLLANDISLSGEPLWVITAGVIEPTIDADFTEPGYLEVGADGSFTFEPPADQSGTVSFEYTVSDGRTTSVASVFIPTLAVNDAPGFVPSATHFNVTPDRAENVVAWATQITAGSPQENASQTLTFVVEAADAAATDFFVQFPAVSSATGALTFTPAADAAGTVEVSITLIDSEGGESDALTVSFAVDQNAPVVAIDPPLMTVIESTDDLVLNGSASDIEDGDLSAQIQWTSDLVGVAGTGATVLLNDLAVGAHQITAAVTDATGLSGFDSVRIDVIAPPPMVTIVRPDRNQVFDAGATIEFQAVDGAAAAKGALDVSWNSNVVGAFAVGANPFAALPGGEHVITATLSGPQGTSTDTVSIVVLPDQNAPVVTITSPADGATVTEGSDVLFAATASDVEDGDLGALLTWASTRDGSLGSGPSFSRNDLTVGAHTISAGVVDSDGDVDSNSVTITVEAALSPPSVAITAPANGAMATDADTISFVAVANDAEDGDLSASIQWTSDLDGHLGAGAAIDLELSAGAHAIIAEVVDSDGEEATDRITVDITEAPSPPAVTIVAPASNVMVDEGIPLILAGQAFEPDAGDISSSIAWSSDLDGALGSGAQISVTLGVGTHQIVATITDDDAETDSDSRMVQVNPVLSPPSLTIDGPADGTVTDLGALLTFQATATDAEDGDLSAEIRWRSSVDGLLGEGSPLVIDDLSVGTHQVDARVQDSDGGTAIAAISLSVIRPLEGPVLKITGPSQALTVLEGTEVSFRARANDREDGRLDAAIQWSSDLAGPLGTGSRIATRSLGVGAHTITAEVSDSDGATASANVSVQITRLTTPPTVTIVSPANGATILAGATANFEAFATDRQDGALSDFVAWTSDRDGSLGSGAAIATSALGIGPHVITATITDSDGGTDTDAVDIVVVEAGETVFANGFE